LKSLDLVALLLAARKPFIFMQQLNAQVIPGALSQQARKEHHRRARSYTAPMVVFPLILRINMLTVDAPFSLYFF
jgi:hypothetical protein